MVRYVLLSLGALTLLASAGGCAGMMQSWREAHCHYDGAFKLGMNHARQGQEMNAALAQQCPAQVRVEVERGYREGYVGGVGGQAAAAPAASGPGWECKNAYGKKACGYGCVAAYGDVACARRPEHNCVQAYGKVRCGHNCRTSYGEIVCDGSSASSQQPGGGAGHFSVSW